MSTSKPKEYSRSRVIKQKNFRIETKIWKTTRKHPIRVSKNRIKEWRILSAIEAKVDNRKTSGNWNFIKQIIRKRIRIKRTNKREIKTINKFLEISESSSKWNRRLRKNSQGKRRRTSSYAKTNTRFPKFGQFNLRKLQKLPKIEYPTKRKIIGAIVS